MPTQLVDRRVDVDGFLDDEELGRVVVVPAGVDVRDADRGGWARARRRSAARAGGSRCAGPRPRLPVALGGELGHDPGGTGRSVVGRLDEHEVAEHPPVGADGAGGERAHRRAERLAEHARRSARPVSSGTVAGRSSCWRWLATLRVGGRRSERPLTEQGDALDPSAGGAEVLGGAVLGAAVVPHGERVGPPPEAHLVGRLAGGGDQPGQQPRPFVRLDVVELLDERRR